MQWVELVVPEKGMCVCVCGCVCVCVCGGGGEWKIVSCWAARGREISRCSHL